MSAVVTIDVMHDNSTFIGSAKLTPPTRFWAKAVADTLDRLRVPKETSITFRRRGVAIRHVALEFLMRGDQ
jgi:hypothetical protein